MRVIREVIVDDVGAANFQVEARRLGIRGVDVHIQRNDGGVITAAESYLAGLNILAQGRIQENNPGVVANFGGPVLGELFRIDRQAPVGLYQAFYRFVDEPIRPYGSFLHDSFEELALAVAGTSGNWSILETGGWAHSLSLIVQATDSVLFNIGVLAGLTTLPDLFAYPANPTSGTALHLYNLQMAAQRYEVNFTNSAAVPVDVRGTTFCHLN